MTKARVTLAAAVPLLLAGLACNLPITPQQPAGEPSATTPPSNPTAAAPRPPGNELIQPGDLVYEGVFRLPDLPGAEEGYDWRWGGSAMAYYPAGDPGGPGDGYPGSLFATGHDWNQWVAEISIPAPLAPTGGDLSALNTAAMLQPFHDVRGDLYTTRFEDWELPRAGLAYLPAGDGQASGKLAFCWGVHMQEGDSGPTHGWCELDLSDPEPAGAWRVADYANYVTSDYMLVIPAEWAEVHTPGMRLATGRFRDGGQGALGPSLIAIGLGDQSSPPAPGSALPAVSLLLYGNICQESPPAMAGYHHSDEWPGAAWLTTGERSAVVFAGTKGHGECWYGYADGTVWPEQPPYPPEPAGGDRGWWSTRFTAQLLFYSTDDLAAVARGELAPHEPQPYAALEIDEYLVHVTSEQQKARLGAASFDPARGLLYLFEVLADDDRPLVHVWRVQP